MAKQPKNTFRYRAVRKALVLNLAYKNELPILTIADEVHASVSTIKKILKESKNEDIERKQVNEFRQKSNRENLIARHIKSILNE